MDITPKRFHASIVLMFTLVSFLNIYHLKVVSPSKLCSLKHPQLISTHAIVHVLEHSSNLLKH